MQIPGLSIRGLLSGVVGQSGRPQTSESGNRHGIAAASIASPEDLFEIVATSPSGRHIFQSFDVRHITPRQFTEILRQMREAGLITDAEFLDLSKIRNDLQEAGIAPDETVDLISFYRQRLQRLTLWESRYHTELAELRSAWEKRLQWLEKIELARQNGTGSLAWGSPALNLDERA